MAAGNLLLSVAILLCGLTFTDIANLAEMLILSIVGEEQFYDLQRDFLYPVVHSTYVRQQESVVEYLRDNQLYLSRYGHCDSLRYSAIYRIAQIFVVYYIYNFCNQQAIMKIFAMNIYLLFS